VKKLATLILLFLLILSGCGSGDSGDQGPTANDSGSASTFSPNDAPKSAKRGIAYDLTDAADFAALAPGVSWWYNWSLQPGDSAPADALDQYDMEFVPMLWNFSFNVDMVVAYLQAHPDITYLLVLNEPNMTGQSNVTPQDAAAEWPMYEEVAQRTGVEIVGPAMTWGTMEGYEDPVAWLDAFYTGYRNANDGRDPQIDYLAFHWYDYGLAGQLDRLAKYGKRIWVTEFANWHNGDGDAQIDTLAKQEAQMADMVATLEERDDVFRYAWFTGRWSPDPHLTSLLGDPGVLTGLGEQYVSEPFQ
jgi:hypothetical protein